MRLHTFALRCLTILGFGAFALSGCSTDLDPNADYKETMVIYSLLNPGEKIHYVKVNKAFLNTKSNAVTIAASNLDSTTFRPEDLTVRLERLGKDSTVLNTYTLERYVSKGKDAGSFFSDSTILYRTLPNQPGQLDENSIYRVVAHSTRSGLSASAATSLVKSNELCIFRVSMKNTIGRDCFDTLDTYVEYEPHKTNNAIAFNTPSNGYIYSTRIDFPYTETTNGVSQQKTITWYPLNNELKSPSSLGENEIRIRIENNSFYNTLANQINTQNDNGTTKRTTDGKVIITVTAGSQLLALNYRANTSYSIYSQTRPEFSNVRNGAGLVSSRAQKVVYATLTTDALKQLKNDTRLKFQ
ncbi:hypothetical protein [Adhaeribacter soli]|uniref:DUF4249 family protein n=1 Tax=Adhaeribacter soli TaxID=2607655 RepID=A0A5N1IJU6_9BACT|nr:hypothetical protein [Adhaeribacter soli]KAA9326045.1 hypothetical protein F0P94_16645 [Adhaeribacter soli]